MDEGAVRRALAAAAEEVRPRGRTFGPEEMAVVVRALKGGATFEAAAEAVGFSPGTVHKWRRKSPAFAAGCADAVAASGRPRLVASLGADGEWKIRRGRRGKFTRERKLVFLEHFAATCDLMASAEVAGVGWSTVYAHRRDDPAFAEGMKEAVEIGVARLEAEAARDRLAAMERLRVRGDKKVPREESEREFERTLAFLREWKRWMAGAKRGGPPLTKWSFEESLAELEKQLRLFGVRVEREREEGAGDGAGG